MIEVALVKRGPYLAPFSQEDADALAGLEPGAVIRARLTGARKQRSYRQLALYWACCNEVAAHAVIEVTTPDGEVIERPDPNWATPELVSEQVKLALRHLSSWCVTPAGEVHLVTGSIGYATLGHLEACRFFERAWPLLAERLGITVAELHRHTSEQLSWAATVAEGNNTNRRTP